MTEDEICVLFVIVCFSCGLLSREGGGGGVGLICKFEFRIRIPLKGWVAASNYSERNGDVDLQFLFNAGCFVVSKRRFFSSFSANADQVLILGLHLRIIEHFDFHLTENLVMV